MAEDLRDYDLNSFYDEDPNRLVKPGEIFVSYGHVAVGYEYPMLKFTVISETDIFGKKKRKKRRKIYEGEKIQSFTDLKPGDTKIMALVSIRESRRLKWTGLRRII